MNRLEAIRKREQAATEGPWSWDSQGDKVNEYVVGIACKPDGTLLEGRIDDSLDMVDEVIYKHCVGEHEAATCNYGDPDFIAHARADIPYLLDRVGELEEAAYRLRNAVLALEGTPIEYALAIELSKSLAQSAETSLRGAKDGL